MKISLNKSDRYLIFLFFAIAIPVTFSGYDYSKGFFEPVMDTIIYCVFTCFVSYIIVFKFFPYYFPEKRIIALFAVTVTLMAICGMIEILCYVWVEESTANHIKEIREAGLTFIMWGISTTAENAGILIGILLGKKFYDAQMDLQEREKEKKESELRLLKSQIDPHFLFNNLNTVDSLIDQDPKIAKEYLQKLSQLYRYLIRTKDDEVVDIEEELAFMRNYIYLLEKRFGSAYVFEIENPNKIEGLIPPGALQTLIENVVKHNKGSNEDPVYTSIILDEESIVVSNVLNLKSKEKRTTNTGLSNLKTRYKLLSDKDIIINQDTNFTVIIPVLKEID